MLPDANHHRQTGSDQKNAMDTQENPAGDDSQLAQVESLLVAMKISPPESSTFTDFADVVGRFVDAERGEVLERARTAVQGNVPSLIALGDALYAEDWAGCEWTAVLVYVT